MNTTFLSIKQKVSSFDAETASQEASEAKKDWEVWYI